MTGTENPLDEVMLAMDVVDTLRHRERVVERALATDEQDKQLVVRLREIYAGQGIEVSEQVLERGVQDLRADRFVYTPAPPSFGRNLARLYVSRGRWGKPTAGLVAALALIVLGYQFFVRGPELAATAALPETLEQSYTAVMDATALPDVETEARNLLGDGQLAIAREDPRAARAAIAALDQLHGELNTQYAVRVVSAPGELSGFFREPEENPGAQNYYLVVEAIGPNGDRLQRKITNEENSGTVNTRRWAQRVDAATYDATVADKRDDGIVQNAILGEKRRGVLEADFRPGVLPGTITDW
jgi:hypothetical protein